jgi:hypothetical protein
VGTHNSWPGLRLKPNPDNDFGHHLVFADGGRFLCCWHTSGKKARCQLLCYRLARETEFSATFPSAGNNRHPSWIIPSRDQAGWSCEAVFCFHETEGIAMKMFGVFALLLTASVLTLGCEKPKDKAPAAAPAEGAPAEAPAEAPK